MHDLDGTISLLLADELHILGIDIGAEAIAPKAAICISLDNEEALRALDLDFHVGVSDRAEPFDILCLPEIGMAMLVEIFRLEVGLAGKCRHRQEQDRQKSNSAFAALRMS